MCGIFGGLGPNYNPDIVRLLALLNEARGTDAGGWWNGEKFYKNNTPIREMLNVDIVRQKQTAFILGHTRAKSTGANTKENAHPFFYDNIVGMHNGIVANFTELKKKYGTEKMEVDSEIIFWLLNEKGLDGLKELEAYWGLAWTDKRTPNKVHLSKHDGSLAYAESDGAVYYSSDEDHLKDIGLKKIQKIKEDHLVTIDTNTLVITTEKLKVLSKRWAVTNYACGQSPYYSGGDWIGENDGISWADKMWWNRTAGHVASPKYKSKWERKQEKKARREARKKCQGMDSSLTKDEWDEYIKLDDDHETGFLNLVEFDRWLALQDKLHGRDKVVYV